MKLLRTTALTAALMTAAVPSLTSSAHAWWGCGGERGWGGVGLGLWYPAYGYGYQPTVVTVIRLTATAMRPAIATPRSGTPYWDRVYLRLPGSQLQLWVRDRLSPAPHLCHRRRRPSLSSLALMRDAFAHSRRGHRSVGGMVPSSGCRLSWRWFASVGGRQQWREARVYNCRYRLVIS